MWTRSVTAVHSRAPHTRREAGIYGNASSTRSVYTRIRAFVPCCVDTRTLASIPR